MNTELRNIYAALRFEENPELHMTIAYIEKATPMVQDWVTIDIEKCLKFERAERAVICFSIRDLFGPRRNVPVLCTQNVPSWVLAMRRMLWCRSDTYGFRPHVTTPDPGPLTLTANEVVLCHKKTVLSQWALKPSTE